MPVSFETGDIFATAGICGYAHGCNCAGAMGKGIAVSFRKRWPAMYEEYRRQCRAGNFNLGNVFVWEEGGAVVFNLGTQKSWTTKAELWAIETSLVEMIHLAEQRGILQIALPRIGAGLGGLDWNDVRSTLLSLGNKTDATLRSVISS